MKAITTIFTVVTLAALVIGCDGGYYDEGLNEFVGVSDIQGINSLDSLRSGWKWNRLIEGRGVGRRSCNKTHTSSECGKLQKAAKKEAKNECRADIGQHWQNQSDVCDNAVECRLYPKKEAAMNACGDAIVTTSPGNGGAKRYKAISEGDIIVGCYCYTEEPSERL